MSNSIDVDPEVVKGFAKVIDRVYETTDKSRQTLSNAIEKAQTSGWNDQKSSDLKDAIFSVMPSIQDAMNALNELDVLISKWYVALEKYESI